MALVEQLGDDSWQVVKCNLLPYGVGICPNTFIVYIAVYTLFILFYCFHTFLSVGHSTGSLICLLPVLSCVN